MDAAQLFPHPFRPHQRELVAFLEAALLEGGHAVAESGTGTGKTAATLAAAYAAADARGLRVLYLVRTNAQGRQVMIEHRRIRARHDVGAAVALQGRAHLCPLRAEDAEVAEADAEELGVMCRDRMRAAQAVHAGERPRHAPCRFHLRGLVDGSDELVAWARADAPDAEALAARVAGAGQCPFVVSRRLLPEARLVVAPYVYALHPGLRAGLLRAMGASMGELLVIVDEAHNLAPTARDLSTAALGATTLQRAIAETRRFGDPTTLRDLPLSAVLGALRETLAELRASHLPEGADDALLPPDEVEVTLLSSLRASTPSLDRAIALMDEYGASVREAKRRENKRPRSEVGAVARFLLALRGVDPGTHAPLVEREGDGARLVLFALDASLLTSVLVESAGSVHVSGTLVPLEEHRDSCGLPEERCALARFPSPFPRENRLVLVDEDVTTRHEDLAHDPAMWGRIGDRLVALRAATDRNMAVFLPSFDALHRVAPHLRASRAFVEARGARQAHLMATLAEFKATRGGTLLSVVGGRVSEGLDFPDEELEVVVVVGLPYARPSARQEALVRFYDRRFGRGWQYAVKVPMVRRVLQAAGRLIRTPTDRGVVVLLDRRAAMLRDVLPEARTTRDPASALATFFASRAPGIR